MWWMFYSQRKVCASTYVTGNSRITFYIFEFSVLCTAACTGQGKQSIYLVYTSEIIYTIPNYFTRLHKLHVCVYCKVFNASDTLNIRMNYEMKKFWKIYLLNYAKIYCFTDFLTPYILYIIIMHIWIAQDNHILYFKKTHTSQKNLYLQQQNNKSLYENDSFMWIVFKSNGIFWICFLTIFSHRPVDIHNVFNAVQVKLLMKEEDFDDNPTPDYDSVFREEEVLYTQFF